MQGIISRIDLVENVLEYLERGCRIAALATGDLVRQPADLNPRRCERGERVRTRRQSPGGVHRRMRQVAGGIGFEAVVENAPAAEIDG